MNNRMFLLLIAVALVLGLLALRFQPACPELHTLDDFENNKTTVCERTK